MDVGANFTAYQELKKLAHVYQPDLKDLPSYQHMVIGLISGAMGPFSNAPIDTIKTRKPTLQRLPTTTYFHHIDRTAEGLVCTGNLGIPTDYSDSKGYVETGGRAVVLQGDYATGSACGSWAGNCVCRV